LDALLRRIDAGGIDYVIVEALDRLSRHLVQTPDLYLRLKFLNVEILTVHEGTINELIVGFKGKFNAIYLTDLANKTRRGLRGRVEGGRSGGGICYGYRVVRTETVRRRGFARSNRVKHASLSECTRNTWQACRRGTSRSA
jgi:DNA invertase Pin-like site-specific DNA recombinase